MTLQFNQTCDNGGSTITDFKLLRDAGALASDIDIQVFQGFNTLYEVTLLTPGLEYRFAYFAINEFGTSAPSWVLTVTSSELPNPPENLKVDWT